MLFSGQGTNWVAELDQISQLLGVSTVELTNAALAKVTPVATALMRAGSEFTPAAWLDQYADREEGASPVIEASLHPSASVPGIALTQLATIEAINGLGLELDAAQAVAGHSQGRLAVAALEGVAPVDVLAVAILAGAAIETTARQADLLGQTMLSILGPSTAEVAKRLTDLPTSARVVVGLRNGINSTVVSGTASGIARAADLFEDAVVQPVASTVAFHHPDLAPAADLVADWAAQCGLDADLAAALTRQALIDPADWVAQTDAILDQTWILDLGPGDLAGKLLGDRAKAFGACVVPVATRTGLQQLVKPGAAPAPGTPWSSFQPYVVTLPDGTVRAETRFTRLTGRSPILLAGMTPTTVDPAIVAAAANKGFWAELAGGGQVSEEIFAANTARLAELLEPGRSYQFNSLFLDPYLWRLQIGGKRLVQRARAAGSAVDGVIVTAGIPELEEATALVAELTEAGIEYVSFKPGTLAQIKQTLAIADAVAPTPVIVQIEGGKAGGHHSWEDLDALLLATYASLRERTNVVVCVGGGIGTPEAASSYLTGRWSAAHGQVAMPLDGVLVGTAAMACLEATTSAAVKQLLVETPGTPGWVKAGTASGGMASGRSQLGADIHEIDNTASRTGRLLDEVAGDAEAVTARRTEIITALDQTAKPYFGDVESMTYAEWLARFLELASTPEGGWLDVTLRDRFHEMLQRAEARLHEADHGEIVTRFATADVTEDGASALARLLADYPQADGISLHPADVPFFVKVCRRPGKPVPFVPVLDADVRRWWRSDSLWQAHDERYGADQVCVIPGPVSVAGITRVDEPVADLLQRFESAVIDDVLAAGGWPRPVPGRRRDDRALTPLALVLAAPDVVWPESDGGTRLVRNPIARLGADWNLETPDRAVLGAATLCSVSATDVELRIPLDTESERGRAITLTFGVDDAVATGAAPTVTNTAEAMTGLLTAMAGTRTATGSAVWTTALAAEHAFVTGAATDGHAVPDALVGLTWPTVFGLLAERPEVLTGVLDLVHLDHSFSGTVPTEAGTIDIVARIGSVAETESGRVVEVQVELAAAGEVFGRLVERFAIRGRVGTAELTAPATPQHIPTPRRTRARATITAPADMAAFAEVSGDHNPIHTSPAAAALAGLPEPIVHGMWLSAATQRVVTEATGRALSGWVVRFLAPVLRGQQIDVLAERVGVADGAEILEVSAKVDGTTVATATATLAPPRTAYAFPGQGIQHQGMGMAGYARSRAAKAIWDRADAHTRATLGFSILEVVRDNPTEISTIEVHGVPGTHRHPDGVLFLTQFTQVAMAVLAAAQMAELDEAGVRVGDAYLAGHSVGEYNALAAVAGALSLEAVVEVVFRRGSVMHTLVPRDAEGRSNYRLAAIRPSQIGLADAEVRDFIEQVCAESGEFLEIANYNLRGSQYAVAGTVRGCELLSEEIERRRVAFGGRGAFVLVPGIDVPFHSAPLRGGVDDFRASLDAILPSEIDPTPLVDRYLPNLVARPFELTESFLASILEVVPATRITEALADFDDWASRPGEFTRLVLIELLAWQFASPVRWIETQELMFASTADGGLGIERFVEVGVGQAPTVANLASATLKLPEVRRSLDARRFDRGVEVFNIERDVVAVYCTDQDPAPEVDDEPVAPAEPTRSAVAAAPTPAAAPAAVGGTPGAEIADIGFAAADATQVLLSWWTKVRPDQLAPTDSIESLCDGVSSRRNQLLVDLGGELGLGAIDGAAEADLPTLTDKVSGLARGYKGFGPVLKSTIADHLKKILGPTGVRPAGISDRVAGHWGLGAGWATHVTAELAMATREGASVKGGDLATIAAPSSAAEANAAIDAAVQSVAARRGIAVAPASSGGGGESATVDAAALGEFTGHLTDALLASARAIVDRLEPVAVVADEVETDDALVLARVEAELGRDWLTATAPAFDARRAVLLDDRWASAREDVVRIAAGEAVEANFIGAGESVAALAEWHGLDDIAAAARETSTGAWADEVALVTGASRGSIAAAVVAELLAGGATVVATTSRLDSGKLDFFKGLYRAHARAGAVLWVLPANMASFVDVDALVEWVKAEQAHTVGADTILDKPALAPTLIFPFAAGSVRGDAADAGSRTEVEARILLWSVERLIGADWGSDSVHVVLPGSPNRGTFGGDGAYGEAKAALDALVRKWSSEKSWSERVTLAHAIIGWVRGTGLMGGNDPLVAAVEAAGVKTWAPQEMAAELLALCTPQARASAADAPIHADFAAGLDGVDLRALAPEAPEQPVVDSDPDSDRTIAALPPSPAAIAVTGTAGAERPTWGEVATRLDDMVVIVGMAELGPYGSSRTRYEVEVSGELSAAGVLELAWSMGLVTWDVPSGGWVETATGEDVPEAQLHERFHDTVMANAGIRSYVDDQGMVDHTVPLLTSVFLDNDLTFTVGSQAEAIAMREADVANTLISPSDPAEPGAEWQVTRKAGTEIRVPRRMKLTRTVGGQIPTGFDPKVWGLPAELVESADRVALWNIVCTVDAFLSSGFTPAELMRWVHPARVANTQGTGMGGMASMQSLYLDNLLGEPTPNDLLQEALPNVIAAHVVQSYVGSYGAMIHPVAACATTAVSVEEGVDKIKVDKADFVVAGGFDDLGNEGIIGFANMSATADTAAMLAQGIDERYLSRANDRRRGGFVESAGGGTVLLARGDVAARMGLPVLGVVAYAGSFGDGVHTSIPAPGIGALAAGIGGLNSPLAKGLSALGLTGDDIGVVSKHDTSTNANDPNESELHERLATALGRSDGNPLLVISQKSLTGHAKGGAAAFQLAGLCQVLSSGLVPPNRSLDCVDAALDRNPHLVWLRSPLKTGPFKAGLVTSLGFGHVSGLIALAHPEAFLAALPDADRETYLTQADQRRAAGRVRLVKAMMGEPAYTKTANRRLGQGEVREVEAAMLLDPQARLGADGVYAGNWPGRSLV
ncbi:type I polyketide synthase [soil metagenome]